MCRKLSLSNTLPYQGCKFSDGSRLEQTEAMAKRMTETYKKGNGVNRTVNTDYTLVKG